MGEGLMARWDNRLYAQFTLDYADSHKIAPLSDAAFRAHVRMILWSRRMLTDGRIPGPMAAVFAKPKVLAELTSNDPENPSLKKVGNDYILHDFAEHQQTKSQIEEKSRVNSENGRRGGRPKVKRSETDSVSETEAKKSQSTEYREQSKEEGRVSELRPDVSRLCNLLADLIEGNGSKRPNVGKGWHDAARLMVDTDGRPLGEAIGLIQWCQADSFWRSNILSMPKFREKYDQLRLQRAGRDEKPAGADPYADLEVVR